ncbi:hypothetical protein BO86DRAFT_55809 [Aspergillus japonicus CBS 114.51]|uniref:Uncharacterized protein n=1 Tax=Aspergillus japonicus CBS 114.51 TaxID=1448312 RepID=A0A8T8X5H1_ASPJA|nr:hypothetical protein BO86DRAFT_55809 [Aspergillus japonicus CBS 114.51]RAH83291.1 hypothetical protein BO86DRAFT_55809 [Aspergillus japonicus CBS 114.51]
MMEPGIILLSDSVSVSPPPLVRFPPYKISVLGIVARPRIWDSVHGFDQSSRRKAYVFVCSNLNWNPF